MIGDWVAGVSPQGTRIVSQVKEIGCRKVTYAKKSFVVLESYDGCGIVFDENDIEPIELTIGMIERNSFVERKEDIPCYHETRFFLFENDSDACLEVSEGTVLLSTIYESYTGAFETSSVCELHYVHELQHVMRLMNLQDELHGIYIEK